MWGAYQGARIGAVDAEQGDGWLIGGAGGRSGVASRCGEAGGHWGAGSSCPESSAIGTGGGHVGKTARWSAGWMGAVRRLRLRFLPGLGTGCARLVWGCGRLEEYQTPSSYL